MSIITQKEIESAFGSVHRGHGKNRVLSDGGSRGSGRLVLRISKPSRGGASAVWYAQQHSLGRKRMVRIGAWPELGVGKARSLFTVNFSEGMAQGLNIREIGDEFKLVQSGIGTLRDLCETYVHQLHQEGRSSWRQASNILLTGSSALCKYFAWDRPARDLRTRDIVQWLGVSYRRGTVSFAAKKRAIAHAVFQYGMTSENDYRTLTAESGIRFGIDSNPVSGIAFDDSCLQLSCRSSGNG